MQLDPMFRDHKPVESNLRGKWKNEGTKTLEEWMAVEEYMGLFERIQVMIQDEIIDLKTFNLIYGYKLFYLVDNKAIHDHKLVERREHWELFIKLWRDLQELKKDPELYPRFNTLKNII